LPFTFNNSGSDQLTRSLLRMIHILLDSFPHLSL
jgi:hypothetical protein